jgi:GNAT superfamily N-acetyltransferase
MGIQPLSEPLAMGISGELASLLSLIPEAAWTREMVLGEQGKVSGRWKHSQLAIDGQRVVGVLLTYERRAEPGGDGISLYPGPSFYLDGMAVAPSAQGRGVASALIEAWLSSSGLRGFEVEAGEVAWSLQTNAAGFNAGVVELFVRRGFCVTGAQPRGRGEDVVMWRRLGR